LGAGGFCCRGRALQTAGFSGYPEATYRFLGGLSLLRQVQQGLLRTKTTSKERLERFFGSSALT